MLRAPHPRSVLLIAVTLLAATSGCIRGTIPARELYRLAPIDTGEVALLASRSDSVVAPTRPQVGATLGIAPFVTPGLYGNESIVYRVGEGEYGSYPMREWAIPLGDMLGVLTEGVLRRAPLTREPALFDPPSLRAQSYIFRGTVREFEEINRGKLLSASVWLTATLVRASDDSVIWSGSARRERPVDAPTMPAVVRVLGILADEAVTELVADARPALLRATAAGAAQRP